VPPGNKAPQWAAAISVAFTAHALLLLGYSGSGGNGAAGEGQGGIEVGLGLLGNVGESLVDTDSGGMLEQESAPEKAPETPPPEIRPEPQLAPVPPEPAQQRTEVAVPDSPSETVAEQSAPDSLEERAAQPEQASMFADSGTAASEGGGVGDGATTQRRRSSGSGNSPGAGGSPGSRSSYLQTLAAHMNRHKHYPMAARRLRQEGTATLSLVIQRDGSVSSFRISKSSGWEALDKAALRMLERAQPLPPFPASMAADEFRVDFPVVFSLTSP